MVDIYLKNFMLGEKEWPARYILIAVYAFKQYEDNRNFQTTKQNEKAVTIST